MSALVNAIAIVLGYWVLLTVAGLLGALVVSLVVDAIRPKPKAPAKPITVDRYGPFLSPYPRHHPVYHVNAPDDASAWRAITESAA